MTKKKKIMIGDYWLFFRIVNENRFIELNSFGLNNKRQPIKETCRAKVQKLNRFSCFYFGKLNRLGRPIFGRKIFHTINFFYTFCFSPFLIDKVIHLFQLTFKG